MIEKFGPDRFMQNTRLLSRVSLLPAILSVFLYYRNTSHQFVYEQFSFLIPLFISLATQLVIPKTKTVAVYYASQIIAVLFGMVAMVNVIHIPTAQLLILFTLLMEFIIYEPYPVNLYETSGLMAVVSLVAAVLYYRRGITLLHGLEDLLTVLLPGIFLTLFGSLMSKYREIVITLMEDHERLTDSVVNLTRANSAYMDYARDAQEQGIEAERRRITRDIHDIVGYTLTNNMMLMEAAQDIMKENALALPTIIETARQNAQEGLDQVRQAMYKLRAQQSAPPTGLHALTQLCKIFQQATGIRVQKNLGNMPNSINEDVDSAVYHFVQEALVNSFRHGKADEVEINFWLDRENLEVSVGDNGLGAGVIEEGIGIKGMRERVGKLGGLVRIDTKMKGFHVYATIPVSLQGGKSHG